MIYKANFNSIQAINDQPDNDRYIFTSKVSSLSVDSHYERLTQKSLDNFVDSLKNEKIALKDSHSRLNSIGHSIDGWQKDGIVYGKFSMPTDRPLGSTFSYPNTKHFIDAIKEEDITMTSVGFRAKTICNIDGKEVNGFAAFFGLGCHEPGKMYPKDPKDKDSEMVQCVWDLDEAKLSETSLVYKGANPDAYITDKIKSGELTPDQIEVLKEIFGTSIDNNNNKSIFDINRSSNMSTENLEKQLESTKSTLETVEKERDELKAANQALEEKVKDMTPAYERGKAIGAELQSEVFEKYKKLRAEGEDALEGDALIVELERQMARLEKMDYQDLLYEKSHVESKLEFQESRQEKPQAEPGQKATSTDSREGQTKDKVEDDEFIED